LVGYIYIVNKNILGFSPKIRYTSLHNRTQSIDRGQNIYLFYALFSQNYINALCCPEYTSPVQFPERFYDDICKYKDYVEQSSKAVITLKSTNSATIQGDEIAVAIASSAIEEKVKELEKGQNGPNDTTDTEQEKSHPPVSQIDPSLKEFAMKLGYTEEAIQQVLKKQAGKEVDQNILLRELINVSSPSLLQKAKPYESVLPSNPTTVVPPRSEVVARGPSAAFTPSSLVTQNWSKGAYYEAPNLPGLPQRNDPIARGQPAAVAKSWLPEQGTYDPYERNVLDRPEDDPFLYSQVVGDSIPTDTSSDLRHIVIDGSNVAMR